MNNEITSENRALIEKAYLGFNNRDIDAVLSIMHPEIHWPKAFEGGYVIGKDAVREYWTKQWGEIDPRVEPLTIAGRADGKVEVQVHQLVKDLEGFVLFDDQVTHVFVINNALLQQMDIELI